MNKKITLGGVDLDSWIQEERENEMVSDKVETTLSYERKLVAFLDLLGITRLIKDNTNGKEGEVIALMEKIKKIVEIEANECNKREDFNLLHISDSFIFSSAPEYLPQLLDLLSVIQMRILIDCKIMLRGAIEFGEVIVKDYGRQIIGPAYINAYLSQENDAIYPRIIVSNNVIKLIEDEFPTYKKVILTYDRENALDYIETYIVAESINKNNLTTKLRREGIIDYLIDEYLKYDKQDIASVRRKYGWTISYFKNKGVWPKDGKNIVIGRNLLETITSALYENPIILFREYVQNSLDAYNESVKHDGKMEIPNFKVAIDISKEEKKIVISDNGYAIEGEGEFERKMLGFGNSDKEDRAQFIGFRGIGRISALPFCKRLIFINKTKGEKIIKRCVWEGKKYQSILNDGNAKFATFQDVIEEIVEFESEISNYNDDEHFFKVIIEDYTYEISEIIEYPNFEQNLQQLLPLKYSDKFKASEKIIAKYKEFMNEDLSDFMCSVYLNDKELTKNYEDSRNVLESDIIFWEIRGKKGNKDEKGEKRGIL